MIGSRPERAAFTAFFYVVFFAEIKNLYLRWLLAGIVLAAAVYVRPVAIYVPIILLPAYAWFYRTQIMAAVRTYCVAALIFIAVFCALLSPWYVRNHDVSGAWGFASIGSYDLFNHYVPYFLNSVYGTDVGETKNRLEAQVGMPVGGPVSTDLTYADAMQSTALHIMLSDPIQYAKYHLSFLPAFFFSPASHEYWRVYNDLLPNSTVAPEPSLAQALNPFSLPLLITVFNNHGWFLVENALWASVLALALIGLWRAPGLRRFIGIVLCLALYFALVTGPLSHARYRMPVDGLLIVSALATLALLWDGDISLLVSSRQSASRGG